VTPLGEGPAALRFLGAEAIDLVVGCGVTISPFGFVGRREAVAGKLDPLVPRRASGDLLAEILPTDRRSVFLSRL
jgi:hypothetical protein